MIGMFNDNSCDKEVVESNEQNAKEIKVAFIFVNNLIMFSWFVFSITKEYILY